MNDEPAVVILGSGTPNPDPARAGSGVAVVDRSSWILVDCGRAVTQRALEAGLDLLRLEAVAITHHHADHVSDLPTLAMARWVAGATTPLPVIVPEGPAAEYVRWCLVGFDTRSFHGQADPRCGPRPTVDVRSFDAPDAPAVVQRLEQWAIASVLVDHPPIEPAVGYRVQRGRWSVVVSGDTAACPSTRQLATGTDVLVHEAVLPGHVSAAVSRANASARDVGALAFATAPTALVLTHMLPPPDTTDRELTYLREVRRGGFAGRTVLAVDLLRLPLPGNHHPPP